MYSVTGLLFLGIIESNLILPINCVIHKSIYTLIEREESAVNQHNQFRKMLYSNNETTCFGL